MTLHSVVVDACSFVSHAATDLILRLHECQTLRVYTSDEILAELERTLQNKIGLPREKAKWRVHEMRRTLADSIVPKVEATITKMTNHVGDRHVAATAVHAPASWIVTENLKHFKNSDLTPHGIVAMKTHELLSKCYLAEPEAVIAVLRDRAEWLRTSLPQLSERLCQIDVLRPFAEKLKRDQQWIAVVNRKE